MADPLSIASGVAGLLSLAMEITKLSYGFISDIRSAHHTQKQYLREVSALTDVLLRSEEAAQAFENMAMAPARPAQLSQSVMDDCRKELDSLRVELARPTHSIFWPIREKSLRKHIDELVRFRVLFSAFLTAQTSSTTTATHRQVTKLSILQSKVELLDWVKGSTDTSIPAPTPLPGTGVWFLESDLFQNWIKGNGSPPQLWCHGPPGVGKSVLASIVLQHLLDNTDGEDRLILRYFCDFASRKSQTKEAIWRSLLSQAIKHGGSTVAEALSSFRSQRPGTGTASLKDLVDIWQTVLSAQTVVLVIDGPDELDSSMVLKGVLAPFIKMQCRIMVTSRDLPEIRSALPLASIQEVLSDQNDLKTYVLGQFEENGMEELLERHPDLESEVVEKSNGIFLLGKILVNQLLALTTVKEMRKVLRSYPIQLEVAFEKTLDRISAQSKSHSTLAHRVINWISSIERPLLASELIHGLAVDQETKSMDDEDMVSVKTILRVCGGLVVLNFKDGHISLVHTTVYIWLRNRGLARTHEDVAGACLSYISLSVLPSGPTRSAEEADVRMRNFPFLSYATQHWRTHLPDDMDSGPPGTYAKLQAMVDEFIGSPSLAPAAFQVANFKVQSTDLALRTATFDTMPTGQTTLHYAAFWDLSDKVRELLQAGFDINATDSQSWTALHWATFARKEAAVRALLHAGAEINLKDSVGWTPLFWAALHGDVSIVAVLLENKASHLHRDKHGWTALRWAASRNHVPVVALFLKHHSEAKKAIGHLTLRCLRGSTIQKISPVVHTHSLLEEAADMLLDSHSDNGRLADLYEVLANGALKAEDLWSGGHFDPPVGNAWRTTRKSQLYIGHDHYNYRYGSWQSKAHDPEKKRWQAGLLRAAIQGANLSAVRLLLELGVETNLNDTLSSFLHIAALQKDPSFVRVLLQFGANIDLKDSNGMTPLQLALADGSEETAALLVTKGANVNTSMGLDQNDSSVSQASPLVLTLGRECSEAQKLRLIRLLLEHGVDVNARTPHVSRARPGIRFAHSSRTGGMTAIHYACHTRSPEIIRTLIRARGDPKALDELGRTAMHHFVYGSSNPSCKEPEARGLPGNESDALLLLLGECGIEYLNRAAKLETDCKVLVLPCFSSSVFMEAEHTPLSLATSQADWRMASTLNRLGAKFHTNIPLTPVLIQAVEALEVDIVELLLQSGAQFVVTDEDQSHPDWDELLNTSENAGLQGLARFEVTIRKAVANGLDINTEVRGGSLLYHLATRGSQTPQPVQILLDAGANPYIPNSEGFDAFLVAALGGKGTVLEVLLNHARAHPNHTHWTCYLPPQGTSIPDAYCTTMQHIGEAMHAAGLINSIYSTGTLLYKAASHGRVELLEALLKNHADPAIGNDRGQRPIHVASRKGHTTMVDVLMRMDGADVNVLDDDQRSPMHLAAVEDHAETIQTLLSHGAKLDLVDSYGFYPLHLAAWNDNLEAARALLLAHPRAALAQTHSLPPEFRDNRPSRIWVGEKWRVTPLHIAAMKGNASIVRLIIDTIDRSIDMDVGALVRLRTGESPEVPVPGAGPTALHMVLDTGTFYGERAQPLSQPRLEIAGILIDHGADVAGVVDHLKLKDVLKFGEAPDVWDRLRVGVSSNVLVR